MILYRLNFGQNSAGYYTTLFTTSQKGQNYVFTASVEAKTTRIYVLYRFLHPRNHVFQCLQCLWWGVLGTHWMYFLAKPSKCSLGQCGDCAADTDSTCLSCIETCQLIDQLTTIVINGALPVTNKKLRMN